MHLPGTFVDSMGIHSTVISTFSPTVAARSSRSWPVVGFGSPRPKGAHNAARKLCHDIGDVLLSQLDAAVLERWRDDRLRAGVASGTVKRDFKVLRSAWEWGRRRRLGRRRLVEGNFPSVAIKVVPTRDKRTPTRAEVLRVAQVRQPVPHTRMRSRRRSALHRARPTPSRRRRPPARRRGCGHRCGVARPLSGRHAPTLPASQPRRPSACSRAHQPGLTNFRGRRSGHRVSRLQDPRRTADQNPYKCWLRNCDPDTSS